MGESFLRTSFYGPPPQHSQHLHRDGHCEILHDVIFLSEAHPGETYQDEISHDEIPHEEIFHGETYQNEIPREEIFHDETSRDEIPREEIFHVDTSHDVFHPGPSYDGYHGLSFHHLDD